MASRPDSSDAASRAVGVPDLAGTLADLAPSLLQSLLIDVHRRVGERQTAGDVLRRYRSDRYSRPSDTDPRSVLAVTARALAGLPPGCVPIAISPICPLGTVSALSSRSQSSVLATDRTAEVVADPTNVLALEAAVRRDALRRDADRRSETVRLATTHRVLRTQPFPPPYSQHFEMLALCTAGAATGRYAFEHAALSEHVAFYLRLVESLVPAGGVTTLVEIADLDRPGPAGLLEDRVCKPLREAFPTARIEIDPDRTRGAGYYVGAALRIAVLHEGGETEIADGGFTDWTQTLLADRTERLLVSGVGLEQTAAAIARAVETADR
jgi:hypothetical protein